MGFSGTVRFRLLVLLLIVLIIWQAYKLYPSNSGGKSDANDQNSTTGKIVEVSVFYEALCPDSRHFFVHHLDPTFKKLNENMSLKLIPYGKAKTFVNANGLLDFECQHGPIECLANKIHACSIDLITEVSQQLEMTNCMIKDNMDPEQAVSKCASLLSIDVEPINDCAKGLRGSQLLKIHGEATSVKKPTFIPTVLVDGSRENQGSLLKNFLLEVCKHFKDFEIPPGCV